jgi:peroxiredoxin-like protein
MADESKSKRKTFMYQTGLRRNGNRAGELSSTGKPSFRVASPPEFKGEAGVWTPEDLFVAAVETCTMTTFLSFAQRKDLALISYESSAEGKLEFTSGVYEFTEIIVRPRVKVATHDAIDQAHQVLEESHHHCLIANSIKGRVILEPVVEA